MILPVEDEIGDVLSKAQKGLGISTEALAQRSGLSEGAIRAARKGEIDGESLAVLAKGLGSNVAACIRLAGGDWRPEDAPEVDGFARVCTPFYDWQVNAYYVWNAAGEAVAIDSGTDSEPLLCAMEARGLELKAILLTHAHRDHCQGLGKLLKRWPQAGIFLNGKEEPRFAEKVMPAEEGMVWEWGPLKIEGLETPGHTAGGMSYCLQGLARPIVFVGDALFAGSMGGANVSYQAGLESLNRLLERDPSTVLAPGHGPLTTVGEERGMNCFSNWLE